MNLIAGAVRLWSSLTGWDLMLVGGTLALVWLMCWWALKAIDREAQREQQAQTKQRLVDLCDWRERKKGDVG